MLSISFYNNKCNSSTKYNSFRIFLVAFGYTPVLEYNMLQNRKWNNMIHVMN